MRMICLVMACLWAALVAPAATAQPIPSMPPGGAVLLGPFGLPDRPVEITEASATIGEVLLSDGKTRIAFEAPPTVDSVTDVTITYQLAGDANDTTRELQVRVDPAYSVATASAAATALEWLFVLLIVALFIEAAVLTVIAVLRVLIRLVTGVSSNYTPSVYKPLVAIALAGLAVYAFRFDPLNDVLTAFEGGQNPDLASGPRALADYVITALLLAGGAESVRRVALAIQNGLKVPDAKATDQAAEMADKGKLRPPPTNS